MTHVITLGSGKQVTLGQYVRAWQTAKQAPESTTFAEGLTGWGSANDKHAILRQFEFGLHDRINRHDPRYGKGRKWQSQWYGEQWRASRDLNNPRLCIHWLPANLKTRFAHRLNREG